MNAAVGQSTTVDFVEEYAAAAERLAVAVAWSDLRAPVPGCPGWTTYDLVVHVGNVHAWAATIVETRAFARVLDDLPRSTKPRAVSAWYVAKAEDLYAVLRSTPYDEPCWNFAFGEGVVGFWPRRQLHETTIHQVDLDAAAGRTTEISRAVARDGVDEVLRVFLHRMHTRGHTARLEQPLALAATDTGDTWTVSPRPRPEAPLVPEQSSRGVPVPGPTPVVEHRRSSVPAGGVADRVEASAELLYRLLWKRADPDADGVRLLGNEARVRAFLGSRLVP